MHSLQVLSLLLAIATTTSALVIPSRARITGIHGPRRLADKPETVDNQRWREYFQIEKIKYENQQGNTKNHDQHVLELKPEHVSITIQTKADGKQVKEKPTSELSSEAYEFSEDEKEDGSDWVWFEDGSDFL